MHKLQQPLLEGRQRGSWYLGGHPPGLLILFFTELWERFSFYGLTALLVTYLNSGVLEPHRLPKVISSVVFLVFCPSVFARFCYSPKQKCFSLTHYVITDSMAGEAHVLIIDVSMASTHLFWPRWLAVG